MKTFIISLIVLASMFACGIWLYQQSRSRAQVQARIAAAEERLRQTEAEAAQQEERNQREQSRLAEANVKLAEKARRAAEQASVLASNVSAANTMVEKPASGFSAVLKDPDMKEAMRKQGRDAVARQVKGLLTTNFIQQLGLNAEQAATLKDLVSRKMTLGFDFMMPVMTGELDDAGLAELGRQTKAGITELDQQIKNLLGDDGYRSLEAQEKSQPDRDQVKKFAARLAENGQPIASELQSQLVNAMSEERRNFRFTVDYSDTSKIDFEHFHDFYSEARLSSYFTEMEQLNERILQRARGILPTEQATEFEEALKNHLQQSKFVVRTTNAMLGKRAAK